jgi:uncharacterized protein (TIRG00374 family)
MEAPKPRRRPVFRIVFNLFVFSLAIWFLWSTLRDVGFEAVGNRLLSASPILVLAVLAANVGRFILLGLRWEIFVRSEAPVGFRSTVTVLMAGNFLGLMAPALRLAGPILRAYYLSKETGRPRARLYGTIVADQTANFSVFTAAMAVSGVLTAAEGRTGMSYAAALSIIGALLGGLYLGRRHLIRLKMGEPSLARRLLRLVFRPESDEALPRMAHRFLDWWEHLLEALGISIVGRGTFLPGILVSGILFTLLAAAQSMAFAAVGSSLSLHRAAFAVSTAAFVQMLAAAPGGPGVTEASLVLIFLALGVDVETAAAGTFLARSMTYSVLVPWGGASLWYLQRRYGKARNSGSEAAPAEA